jgi:hypothetical protein
VTVNKYIGMFFYTTAFDKYICNVLQLCLESSELPSDGALGKLRHLRLFVTVDIFMRWVAMRVKSTYLEACDGGENGVVKFRIS